MASDTTKYGTIFEPGSFVWKGLAQLGPLFQVSSGSDSLSAWTNNLGAIQFFIGPFARVVVVVDAQAIEEVFKVHARSMDSASVSPALPAIMTVLITTLF